MSKLFFITSTYPDLSAGGAIIRKSQVELFREANIQTWVIVPNYYSNKNIVDATSKICQISAGSKLNYFNEVLQKAGIIEDAHKVWISNTVNFLVDKVKPCDIVFCVSGGQLETFIIGSQLKAITGCRYIANLHDPIINATAKGKKIRLKSSNFPHVNRDRVEKKYLRNVDYIFTCSRDYKEILKDKYPELRNKVQNSYFGYITSYSPSFVKEEKLFMPLRIGYGGNMGKEQSPELLGMVAEKMMNVEAYFFGNISNNHYLKASHKNVTIKEHLKQVEFLEYMYANIDIAFLSLVGDLSTLCIPSKLYEYINLELPMIAVVGGDAARIVSEYGIGVVCEYSESSVEQAILRFMEPGFYLECLYNIKNVKELWSMSNQSRKMLEKVASLVTTDNIGKV